MKSIVIATDGSASAAGAVAFGLELATEQGAEVTFVHVLPPDDFFVAGRGGPALPKPHHVEMDKSETPSRRRLTRRKRQASPTRSSAYPATRSTRSSPLPMQETPT